MPFSVQMQGLWILQLRQPLGSWPLLLVFKYQLTTFPCTRGGAMKLCKKLHRKSAFKRVTIAHAPILPLFLPFFAYDSPGATFDGHRMWITRLVVKLRLIKWNSCSQHITENFDSLPRQQTNVYITIPDWCSGTGKIVSWLFNLRLL